MSNSDSMKKKLDEFILKTEVGNQGISKDLQYLKQEFAELKVLVTRTYATKQEVIALEERIKSKYDLTTKIVYGLVGIILVAVIGAIIGGVIG